MSIPNEEVLNVPNWTPHRVEKWMFSRKLPTSMIKTFHNKYSINGEKLLNLQKEDIKQLCHETNASGKHIFILTDSIQNLQRQYYEVQRNTRKVKTNPSSRKKSRQYSTSGSYEADNAENYGSCWTQTKLINAWRLWLKHKDFRIVSQKIGRTYLATLTKINLIRRSISESNNAQYKTNITNYHKLHHYNFTKIINQQKQKENQKNQSTRMKDNGINVEFEHAAQKYTHKNTKALQNNKHKTNHNIKLTKKRNQNNEQNQRKKLHKIFNHDNQHKHNTYNKQNIKNIKKELWRNDRQLSTEERKQLQNRGIYVVEQLIKHKKNPNDKQHYFCVKWLDYSSDENTWEPESNISPSIIKEYFNIKQKSHNEQLQCPPKKKRKIINHHKKNDCKKKFIK